MNIQINNISKNCLSNKWYADISVTYGDNIFRHELKFHNEPTIEQVNELAQSKFTVFYKILETNNLIKFTESGNDPRGFSFIVLSPLEGFNNLLKYIVSQKSDESIKFLLFAREYTAEGLSEQIGISMESATFIVSWIQSLLDISNKIDETELIRQQLEEIING